MADLKIESVLPDIEQLVENRQTGALLNILIDMHPADIEVVMNRLKREDRHYLFSILPPDVASTVLPELDSPLIEQVLEEVDHAKLSAIIDQMESDDAADIVAELPDDVAERVLEKLETDVQEEVKELLTYPEESAGGIMAVEVLAVRGEATTRDAIEKIREMRDEVEHFYNIWVVDQRNHFIGGVSLTDLVLASDNTRIREIMNPDFPTISVDMDQEEVANFFKKYDLVSAPVLDNQHRLVGRITVDDIVDVLEEEGSEDIARISGAPEEELMEDSPYILARARMPWLLVAFTGELLAAYILSNFQVTLSQMIMAAFFIPIVMAMGGSSGQQASVIVVRGLSTGDIELRDTRSRLYKEFRVSMLNSLFFSVLLFVIVFFWDGPVFASILGLSMFIVVNTAALVGATVPLLFKRLNIDPALAAAPLVSTSNDIFGLVIYLTIATITLSLGIGN